MVSMHRSYSEVFLEGKVFKDLQHPRLLTTMSWRCGWNDLRIMRWELVTRTGGLADIAFMVEDVVQRELGTYLYRGVRSWSTPLHGRAATNVLNQFRTNVV